MNDLRRAAFAAAISMLALAPSFAQASGASTPAAVSATAAGASAATASGASSAGSPTEAGAASAAASGAALSLAEVRKLTLGKSAAYAKAELALKTAELGRLSQAYDGIPSLSAQAGGSYGYGDGSSFADSVSASLKLTASQTLFDGGKQAALLKSEALAVEAAKENLRAVSVDLIGQADAAFFAVLNADASVDAAAADLSAARIRLDLAKAKAEAGVIARSDYLQAESEAASYSTTLIKARKTQAAARAKLASLSGLQAGVALQPAEPAEGLQPKLAALDEAGAAAVTTAALAAAARGSPSLAAYALATGQAGLAVMAAKAAYLPSVDASLSHAMSWNTSQGVELGSGSVSLSATLGLDLWATKAAVDTALAASSSASVAEAEAARVLALDVEVAVGELLGAAKAVDSSAKALTYAESNYDGVLERYRLSSASASELSSALALVSTARTSLIGARYDFLGYLSELRGLCGLEDEAGLAPLFP